MAKKVIKDCILNWCFLNKLDDYGKYGCKATVTKEGAKKLKDLGLKVKKDEDGTYFMRFKRAEDKGPVVVLDKDGEKVTQAISNGAKANVMIDVYTYKSFGGGIACRLDKIQLISWEPYGASGEDEDFDDDDDSTKEGDELF